MSNDKPPRRPKPLTPIEKMQLAKLLEKSGATAAPSWSPEAVAERKLRAEQEALIKKEARAAARLAELQSNLDRVTTDLEQMVRTRIFSRLNSPEVLKHLRHYAKVFAEHLSPGWAAADGKLPDVADVLRTFVEEDLKREAARRAGATPDQEHYDLTADTQRVGSRARARSPVPSSILAAAPATSRPST